MVDYVLSTRAVRSGSFVIEVGPSKFLAVPDDQDPDPSQAITSAAWYKAVRAAAEWKNDDGAPRGDVLFVVHGFNNSEADIMQRHRLIRDDLAALGFKGVVVSFDWPCAESALAYLPDRHRAKQSALQLVSDGIVYLARAQSAACTTNVHVLGHSTGAYVIREAFHDADDTQLQNGAWTASQIIFFAGDVSADSMLASDGGAESVFRHCVRLTNYSRHRDQVLDISNVKRVGVAPRVGRIGLPDGSPSNAVNVDCTNYYPLLDCDGMIKAADQSGGIVGVPSHSWYFGNRVIALDLFNVIIGSDRTVMTTRTTVGTNRFLLKRP